ncbi:MAG: outer membrane protein assembly factor BamE [Rhizobiaceae bacterium]|nr:outer membrane protein assembly factor BamE [Rhizobiaceae bacterium]
MAQVHWASRECGLSGSVLKRPAGRGFALGAGLLGAAIISGCNTNNMVGDITPSETLTQGYVVDQQSIDMVPIGSSREQVLLALGSPSTTATFDNEVFYYISQTRRRSVAFAKPKLVDQRVLAVYFGPDDRVTQLANYGLKDGKLFDFISRTTPTGGKDRTFLGQILAGPGDDTDLTKTLLGG